MTENNLVYIIVLNWNGWKDTLKCLELIQKLDYLNYQVLLIDNASQDDSVEQIRKWSVGNNLSINCSSYCNSSNVFFTKETKTGLSISPLGENLILLESTENLGFSGGCNLGITYALQQMADYVFLLNNDTSFKPNILNHLLNVSQDVDAAIVGARVIDVVGEIFPDNNEKIALFSRQQWHINLFHSSKKIQPNLNNKYWETSVASGSALLLRKDLLQQRVSEYCYFLNPDFFMYSEEIDLCIYGIKKDYHCIIVRDAVVYHYVSSASGGQGNPRTYYYCTRNQIFLANHWLNLPWKVLFHLYYVPSRLLLLLIKLILTNQNHKVAIAVVSGLVDGYQGVTGKWINH